MVGTFSRWSDFSPNYSLLTIQGAKISQPWFSDVKVTHHLPELSYHSEWLRVSQQVQQAGWMKLATRQAKKAIVKLQHAKNSTREVWDKRLTRTSQLMCLGIPRPQADDVFIPYFATCLYAETDLRTVNGNLGLSKSMFAAALKLCWPQLLWANSNVFFLHFFWELIATNFHSSSARNTHCVAVQFIAFLLLLLPRTS